MTELQTVSPVDKVIDKIAVAMHEWSDEQVESIGIEVRIRLNRHRDEILMKLMGFDRNYDGRWNVDHCNGRAGDSNISDYLKEKQGEIVKEWLSEIKLPVMTSAFKQRIATELQNTYERAIQDSVYTMARDKASKDLQELLDSTLTPTLYNKYQQAQALLTPT